MSDTFYFWKDNTPVNLDRDKINECFITGESIPTDANAYWTQEFDAWISERGYQMIQNAHSTGELNKEWELIYGEWYAKDETVSGRQDSWSEWVNAGLYRKDG